MSRPFFIVSFILTITTILFTSFASSINYKAGKGPVVITSQTLTADNKGNKAIFEGLVVAKTEDVTIHSDKMIVFYDNSENKIREIHALGNVKVLKKNRAIFADEAMYIDDEKKIIFKGNPRAIDGKNVITGKQIIFFLDDDRAVVEESRVILQNQKENK